MLIPLFIGCFSFALVIEMEVDLRVGDYTVCTQMWDSFWVVVAKLQKATIRFIMSICLSVSLSVCIE
jgi:hypothetical protein